MNEFRRASHAALVHEWETVFSTRSFHTVCQILVASPNICINFLCFDKMAC